MMRQLDDRIAHDDRIPEDLTADAARTQTPRGRLDGRPVPFWSWNERMEPELVRAQVDAIADGGWGGAFIHARVGLTTPYLDQEWFDAVDATIEQCRERGLKVWLYDEDTWPSGFSGGRVPLLDERFRMKALLARRVGGPVPSNCRAIGLPVDGVQVYSWTAPLGNPWFHGACYADLLDPECVEAFIADGYGRYHARYAALYGSLIAAQFTDEPSAIFRLGLPRGAVPFSPRVLDRIRERWKFDPVPRLHLLFVDAPGSTAFRWKYYRAVSELFETNFARRVGEWCERQGIALTGHFMAEHSLHEQQLWGGPVMPCYRHQSIPGIDHLTRQVSEVLSAKQCQSVVNQYGKKHMLSELYGVSGQSLSFADRWWIASQQIALGVNLLNPHLALYTLAGCRKRDYPPNLFYQQPWWPLNKVVDQPLARLCEEMTRGEYQPELLVLHPHDSVWMRWRAPVEVAEPAREDAWEASAATDRETRRCIEDIDIRFRPVVRGLLARQRQFDLGDETILADEGGIELDAGRRPIFRVGRMRYAAVVVPTMDSIRSTTLDLLEQFLAAGGIVIRCGDVPFAVDGEPSDRPAKVLKSVPVIGGTALPELLDELLPPIVRVSASESLREHLLCHARRDGEQWLLFMANTSRRFEGPVRVHLKHVDSQVARFLPGEGTWVAHPSEVHDAQHTSLETYIPAGDSVLFRFGPTRGVVSPRWRVVSGRRITDWTVERLDENAITLDLARWSEDAATFSTCPVPVIAIQRRLNELQFRGRLRLRHTFLADLSAIDRPLQLVIEYPGRCTIRVNGQVARHDGRSWWRDVRWSRIDIAGLVRAGENEIELDFAEFQPGRRDALHDPAARYGTEIESIYLVGDFHVAPLAREDHPRCLRWSECGLPEPRQFALPGEGLQLTAPCRLLPGDVTSQGLPFYAGRIRWTTTVESSQRPRILRAERLDAAVAEVQINGRTIGHLWREPLELMLPADGGQLTITLYSTLRNLLGPHHHPEGDLPVVAPHLFEPEFDSPISQAVRDWSNGTAMPRQWRDDYSVIAFGDLGHVTLHEARLET